MAVFVEITQLSPTMTEGILVEWSKKEGDKVEPGDALAAVETDKAVMDIEAFDEGILLAILAEPSSKLPVGAPIAIIGEAGEEISAMVQEAKEKLKELQSSSPEKKEESSPQAPEPLAMEEHPKPPIQTTSPPPSEEGASVRIKASPLARKLASMWNISLESVQGSGPNGRIVKKDIEAARQKGGQVSLASFTERKEDIKVSLSMMRQSIARRLFESKSQIPHFYLNKKLKLDALIELRTKLNQDIKLYKEETENSMGLPDKISVNDFMIRANALALLEHPNVNAQWNNDSVILKGNIDIGIAVAIDDGLITPIVRNAQAKNIFQISLEAKQLVKKARDRKLSMEEFTGGTFTISNLGMYGIDSFNAIVNPPEAAIMAIGKATKEPVWEQDNQNFIPQETIMITLSCDHRVVDGAIAAEYLKTFAFFIEHPRLLV